MKPIIGIDLGTTNSEVAVLVDGRVEIVSSGFANMLPSCVGLSPEGALLIGAAAKNQHLLYPERTVLAVKRKMGLTEPIVLGDQSFSPQEISSLILKELVAWAGKRLGETPERAVVTVPAYFSDAQRQATREAGILAGLEVERIVNEPTAASLAYNRADQPGDYLVYDLGGGTFDVSVIHSEAGVTEVLSSHGNNQLGGNDFTELLFDHLADRLLEQNKVDIRKGYPKARSQLWWACETAKTNLSQEPFATVREENLLVRGGKPLHFEAEVARDEYETLIRPLVESTMESVTKALTDAHLNSTQLKDILLVGGSTRTPLIQEMLRERSPAPLHQEVHPDLCVALGAGILGAQLSGEKIDRALVDITAYSFGISYLGYLGGVEYPHCYKPIVLRNSALPITRTERYFTAYEGQPAAEIDIFQGEDPDALRNIQLGDFIIEGLDTKADRNEILCRMHIDLNGMLHVSATEKATGLTKDIRIENALRPMSEAELQTTRKRMESLYRSQVHDLLGHQDEDSGAASQEAVTESVPIHYDARSGGGEKQSKQAEDAATLIARSRSLLERMHPDDREEAIDLHERIESAIKQEQEATLKAAVAELEELVFYIDGK